MLYFYHFICYVLCLERPALYFLVFLVFLDVHNKLELAFFVWGRNTLHSTLEHNIGFHAYPFYYRSLQGIPGPEIPSIVMPPPPTFPTLTSLSPIFFPEMILKMSFVWPSNGESAKSTQNMDNTCRAEDGMFGGFFDAHGNDANGVDVGNFFPPGDDLPAF
ncbi:hypothetical protein ZWY2020_004876 [Hordeum vulgare]|nr:hypothetical protein ZWY2020_004876 [Hordeum vulgare]